MLGVVIAVRMLLGVLVNPILMKILIDSQNFVTRLFLSVSFCRCE